MLLWLPHAQRILVGPPVCPAVAVRRGIQLQLQLHSRSWHQCFPFPGIIPVFLFLGSFQTGMVWQKSGMVYENLVFLTNLWHSFGLWWAFLAAVFL